jgi:nitrite reductase/ring-hydroxylating ferredoxin subunit
MSLAKKDGLLKNNWYIACLKKELNHKPLRRIIYDEPLVLFRNSEGKVICLKDICLHRGTALSRGKVKGNCIQCPYHGWTYDQSGKIEHIPGEGPDNNQIPTKLSLQTYPVIEQDDVIWVWMGELGKENEKSPWRFPNYHNKKWVRYFMVTDFDGEVSQLVENFMDVPHTVTVHSGWFRNPTSKKVPIEVEAKNGEVLVKYDQKDDQIGVLLRPLVNPGRRPMVHTDQFIFPNITRVDYFFGDNYQYIINSQCTPVSENKSRVYTFIGYRLKFVGKFVKPLISFYTRQVIEQDVRVIDHQYVNANQLNDFKEINTSCDLPHVYMRKIREMGKTSETEPFEFTAKKSSELYI